MFGRATNYAYVSALVALISLASCAGNVNPPRMPSSAMSVPSQNIDPTSRLAAPDDGTTFYVNGVRGSDKNDCRSPQRACKTIAHAVHISASGDTIDVAAAVYPENVTIHHSLRIHGAGAGKTIVDGERHGSEFLIAFNNIEVTITGMTMRDGSGSGDGGAIYHCNGKLTLEHVVIQGNLVRGPASTATAE